MPQKHELRLAAARGPIEDLRRRVTRWRPATASLPPSVAAPTYLSTRGRRGDAVTPLGGGARDAPPSPAGTLRGARSEEPSYPASRRLHPRSGFRSAPHDSPLEPL